MACMGKKTNECKILVGKTEGKSQLVRHRHRWEQNFKMDLKGM
jgi:hypothetical protein